MRILGIVAEYDPFHNGHLFHLNASRELVRPDFTYVAMSPCCTQRGSFSMFSPYDRAKCAVLAGADAVFAMPVLWTVRDAEHYALGAVSMLNSLGITHLAFGAETDDLQLLLKISDTLESQDTYFSVLLHAQLKKGIGYPYAVSSVIESIIPEASGVMSLPNNILAVCYLRAIRQLNDGITPVLVKRSGSYHSMGIDAPAPSASSIRSAMSRGNWHEAYTAIPEFVRSVYRDAFLSKRIADKNVANQLIIHTLRSLTKESASVLPDISEGLDDYLINRIKNTSSQNTFRNVLSSKRYTTARINRICYLAMLDITSDQMRSIPYPTYAFLLAIHKNSNMTACWKKLPFQIISSLTEVSDSLLAEADLRAFRLWAFCAGLPDSELLSGYLFNI